MGNRVIKNYVIYDGRAYYDEEEASILDVMNDVTDRKEALKIFAKDWTFDDACLFEYDVDSDGNLTNGIMLI